MTFYSLLSEDFYIVRSHPSDNSDFVLWSNHAAANVRRPGVEAANNDNRIEEIVFNLAVQDLHKL